MSETKPVLLLTRPLESSKAFLEKVRGVSGASVEAIISPVIEIEDHGPLPDLTNFRTVILTSGHAVRRLGRAGLLNGLAVASVGDATGRLARSYGALVEVLGENADALVNNADRLSPPCLHCRGVYTRGDTAARLTSIGIQTAEAVVYDQSPLELSDAAKSSLHSNERVIAPVFSPRSAALLSPQIDDQSSLDVIAISEAAAQAWGGSAKIKVVPEPTADAMALAVAASF